ncbi:MAG: MbcA/ParS/Xre antitoxin family protein [Pseudomonadota bacterium]
MPQRSVIQPHNDREAVLSKALIAAADIMGLSQALVAKALGISESSVSRLRDGRYVLSEARKEWELARLLVRIYRSLDAMMAGDEEALRAWLRNDNTALRGAPIDLIASVEGLTRTVNYVDAYRARV